MAISNCVSLLLPLLLRSLPVFASRGQDSISDVWQISTGGGSQCTSGFVDVHVTATNLDILCTSPRDQHAMTNFMLQLAHKNVSNVLNLLGDPITVDGSYSIYAKLCFPTDTSTQPPTSVQLLTHGGTLDHNYWDIGPGYSYVDASTSAGYATLSYDRVGTGLSEHPDPIGVVQSGLHLEVIHALSDLLRNGAIGGHAFEDVIGVGHSIGAWATHGAASKYPEDLDAIVLTGVSGYTHHSVISLASCVLQIANEDSSGRWKELSNGYLVTPPVESVHQYNFYDWPNYDVELMRKQYGVRETIAMGDILTILQQMKPSGYRGPVDIVTGEHDFICCGSDCHSTNDKEYSHGGGILALVQPQFMPYASKGSRAFAVPKAGHNIVGHHNAKDAEEHILRFLNENGIGPKANKSRVPYDMDNSQLANRVPDLDEHEHTESKVILDVSPEVSVLITEMSHGSRSEL